MNVQRQEVITQPFHHSHTSSSSLHLLPASWSHSSSHKNSLTLSVTENNMRFSSIVLLLGAVSCTLAAPTPAPPAKAAAKEANKGVAPPSNAKAIAPVADDKAVAPVPVADGEGVAPIPVADGKGVTPPPANAKGTSPTGDKKKDNKDVVGTVKPKPFDGKSSIPYKPKPFQCEC
jgi:hypothetical protein